MHGDFKESLELFAKKLLATVLLTLEPSKLELGLCPAVDVERLMMMKLESDQALIITRSLETLEWRDIASESLHVKLVSSAKRTNPRAIMLRCVEHFRCQIQKICLLVVL
ncbi:hypothetical protein HUJ04_000523 [Dendroctonus ponderosae]|nr:hypothetical protein HUJ04_000523 [Dendroctonus ponderosae]